MQNSRRVRQRKTKPVSKTIKLEVKKEVRNNLRRTIESKELVRSTSGTPLSPDASVGTITSLLTGIVRGDNEGQFAGKFIQPTSLVFNFAIDKPPSFGCITRLILLQTKDDWYPTNMADVLQANGSVSAVLSSINPETNHNFRVLMDRTFTMKGDNNGTGVIVGKRIIKKLAKVEFANTTVISMLKGDIVLFACSDTLSPNVPAGVRFFSKVKYTDA